MFSERIICIWSHIKKLNTVQQKNYTCIIFARPSNATLILGLKPSTTGAIRFGVVGDHQKEKDDQN